MATEHLRTPSVRGDGGVSGVDPRPAAPGDTIHVGRAWLLAQRITESRIVDGHADLLADDIFCLPDGPVLLDCLEFDDHLRYIDGIADAAFLAMDLEFLGRSDLGGYFLDEYSWLAGDSAPPALKDLYIAYRAVVRAKVTAPESHRAVLTPGRRAATHRYRTRPPSSRRRPTHSRWRRSSHREDYAGPITG